MRILLSTITLIASVFLTAQNVTVTYSPANTAIANPERGLYKHTETHSNNYTLLSQSVLNGYRTDQNITLILRVFYLENFISSSISSTYLSNMQSDFAKVRAAGLKCIVRFAYSDDDDSGLPQDATKSQVLAHINQLKPILLANSDIIPVVQAGFIGAWGEWYYTTNFGQSPTATDFQNRRDVVNALLGALPPGKMVQIRTPSLKQKTYSSFSALGNAQAFTNETLARVGHHNDCFLASATDYGTYNSNNLANEYAYLEQETKFLPMGGETCAPNLPRSGCASAINEMAKFHWSYLNISYHEGVMNNFITENCFTEIENRLGYRFELQSGVYPAAAVAGTIMPISMVLKNKGFASPYNARATYIVLRNTVTNAEFSIPVNTDIRYWFGGTTQTILDNIALPSTLPAGSYKLFLHMPDVDSSLATRGEYAIRFANSNIWDSGKGYNDLQHTVTVTAPSNLAVGDNNVSNFVLYPVPTSDALNIEFDGIEDYDVTVHNSIGQKIGVPMSRISSNKVVLDTHGLSNGVYFVSVIKGNAKETKRIIVKH